MGRGRVQLKRIENKINRQVTFSKRRAGLVKKAHEISVLCDAEVALIVFSNRGKLSEYSTDSCMEKLLEKYERYSYAERQLASNHAEAQDNWTFDYAKLKAKIELLERSHGHYLGKELDSLSMKELESLEQQMDTALKRIRSRKNQLMHESISELQKKEKAMQEQNNLLAKKIKERGKTKAQEVQQWQQQAHHVAEPSNFMVSPLIPTSNLRGVYQGETASEIRRNDLDLTLEPVYPCHLGFFAT
ncbi:hypothetical protein Nepgr_003641 [Nepenthes gracilis]|uniref:Uncharacterized protein n=1 Tax=Nepenthes gracilis TaxID=150966 RepID=A0AAD3S000_NEPGR|nr:hypothetical protein Nepgr_003641 [Nepenthes gracilis]